MVQRDVTGTSLVYKWKTAISCFSFRETCSSNCRICIHLKLVMSWKVPSLGSWSGQWSTYSRHSCLKHWTLSCAVCSRSRAARSVELICLTRRRRWLIVNQAKLLRCSGWRKWMYWIKLRLRTSTSLGGLAASYRTSRSVWRRTSFYVSVSLS